MGISSVGAGSGVLTQDVLDQLRTAEETTRITPIEFKIANEEDKKAALEVVDAAMENLADSISELTNLTLYNDRTATVSGSSVEVSADNNTDLQDFSIKVTQLATKQIEESGSFTSEDSLVSGSAGQLNLNIDGEDFQIDYEATTTLKELKNLINDVAGDKVDATVAQIGSSDFRLYVSSSDTGATQDITISDLSGTLDSKLTSGLTEIQGGVNANFEFNGVSVIRTSNEVDDLISGVSLTLKSLDVDPDGILPDTTNNVSIAQDTTSMLERFESFVSQYNAAFSELQKVTKSSIDSDVRGIFSSESTIKSLQNSLQSMIGTIGGGVGSLYDYGIDVDKDGFMTLDTDTLESALKDNPSNTQAFFVGGDYKNSDGSITTVDGAFNELESFSNAYMDYNGLFDQFQNSITDSISSYNDDLVTANEKLDAKFEILKQQYIAYDLIMSEINSASSMFTQLTDAMSSSDS